MQVNLSANLSNPAGETNAKSAEGAEAGAADGFFAQMGQILNQGNETSKAQAAPVPSVPAPNATEKNARRLLQGISLLMPQALTVDQAPVQKISGVLSQRSQGNEDAATVSQCAGATQALAEKSARIALAPGMESIPVSVRNAERVINNLQPPFQFPGDSSITVGAPQPVIADRSTPEEIPIVINGVGLKSEGRMEYPTTPAGYAIQKLQPLDLQKVNAPLPEGNIAPEAAGTVKDIVVSRNSMLQIEDLRVALQAGLGNAPQSIAGQARVGNETDMRPVPQDQAPSAQVNLDFVAAETAASRPGMQGQPAGIAARQGESLTDDLALSEMARSQTDDSPVTILKKSLKTMPASLENSDTATASAAQGQTLDKLRPWMTLLGKPDQGQSHSGQQQLSGAERQPQMQSVIASSPSQYGESTGSVILPPAQSSTSNAPELYFQLADQIRIQLRDGKSEIRIQLKPDGLGRLEIRAENTAQGVSARISTDSGAVKSYLENNLQLLQQTLQDQGLKIDRIHIVVLDALDSHSSSGNTAQFGHAGSGQNGKEPQLSSGKSGASHMIPIDETGLDPATRLALNPNSSFYTVA